MTFYLKIMEVYQAYITLSFVYSFQFFICVSEGPFRNNNRYYNNFSRFWKFLGGMVYTDCCNKLILKNNASPLCLVPDARYTMFLYSLY